MWRRGAGLIFFPATSERRLDCFFLGWRWSAAEVRLMKWGVAWPSPIKRKAQLEESPEMACALDGFPLRGLGLASRFIFHPSSSLHRLHRPGAYNKPLPLKEYTRTIEKNRQRSIVFQMLLSFIPARLFHSVSSIGG
jgi:hypothetical protein